MKEGELRLISAHSGIEDKDKLFLSFCRYFRGYRICYSGEFTDEELFECVKDRLVESKKEESRFIDFD